MNKILRYSFVALMAMMGLMTVAAQDVAATFDFDNDYQTLFPTLAGTSSGSSTDGDFTETTTSTAVNGFTVTVTAAESGTANRIWNAAPRLRMYSGQLTVKGTGITKIEFTGHKSNFNIKPNVGTLEGKTWTGSADEIVFTVSKNTQINNLVIYTGEGGQQGGDPEEPTLTGNGTLDNPYTAADANIVASQLESGAKTATDVYVKGKVSSIKYTFSASYGTATFYISDDGTTANQFYVYSAYYLENKGWVEGNTQIAVGDEVVICGKLINYSGTYETSSKEAYIYSLNGKTKEETTPTEPEVKEGTCADVIAGADGDVFRVTGKCIEIKNTTYGNWNLEDETGTIYIYGTLDAEGKTKNFSNLGIEVGDVVTVEGPKTTYNTTVELVNVTVISIVKATSTGISSVKAATTDAALYNLAGQKVGKDYKGIVIMNGKKMMQK